MKNEVKNESVNENQSGKQVYKYSPTTILWPAIARKIFNGAPMFSSVLL
jgi:hypothetical protein